MEPERLQEIQQQLQSLEKSNPKIMEEPVEPVRNPHQFSTQQIKKSNFPMKSADITNSKKGFDRFATYELGADNFGEDDEDVGTDTAKNNVPGLPKFQSIMTSKTKSTKIVE